MISKCTDDIDTSQDNKLRSTVKKCIEKIYLHRFLKSDTEKHMNCLLTSPITIPPLLNRTNTIIRSP